MKFMNSFQCLMGGNAVVQFKDFTQQTQSSIMLLDNDDKKSSTSVTTKKKKKTKTKKKKDKKVIKVFKPEYGEINLYYKSIRVSELMTDQEHMVCRSDSFYIGHKIPPLSQNERLQPGHSYFLLPAHFFHSVLSFLTIASFTSSSKQQDVNVVEDNNANMKMKAAFLKKAAACSCSPFDIQKTPSGTLRIRVSELFISQMMMDHVAAKNNNNNGKELLELEGAVVDLLCTTPQLHREYKQLVVGSRRVWKPKLEMIKESPLKGTKRKVKMLLSASINRMKKKMKKSKSVHVPEKSSSSSSSSASSKKKKKKMSKKSLKPVVVSLPPSSASLKSNKFFQPHVTTYSTVRQIV